MDGSSGIWTWKNLSRLIGVTIVIVLFGVFVTSFITGLMLNTTITLSFLGLASFLIGAPSGWQLVLKRNGGNSK